MPVSAGSISADLEARIATELTARRDFSPGDYQAQVESGEGQAVIDSLLFFTDPADFTGSATELLAGLEAKFTAAAQSTRPLVLDFLIDLSIGLRSFLPIWNLRNSETHGDAALEPKAVAGIAAAARDLLAKLEAAAPAEAATIIQRRRADALARLTAEVAADPAAAAERLTGGSLADFVDRVSAVVESSHLRRLAERRATGDTITELGNDYAIFLQHTMYVGMSFVTSNPVLVDVAWVADPDTWSLVVDAIIKANPDADESELARLATLEVVLANMRLLRPIFLLTGGKMGYVSLQVNPKKHGDHASMIADATALYAELSRRFDGGVPNVVFKLPGTNAGLTACRHVTSRGIGVNITVNFAMFQQLPFATAIHEGQALASYLTEMNGRLAYPVRDELLAKLDEFAAGGVSESQVRAAAAWSGVAVTRRLHQLLSAKGYDLIRVRPLIASLRWYEGAGHETLPDPCPDVIDCAGVSVITIFPNVRHALDGLDAIEWRNDAVAEEVEAEHLEILKSSELFKQAYFVGDSEWVRDDREFAPDFEIRLADEAATVAFVPINATLTEFGGVYDVFVRRLDGRGALLALAAAFDLDALRTALTDPLPGTVVDGLEFAANADDNGIAALLGEEDVRTAVTAAGDAAIALHQKALD
ncbi:MAG: transaldolase family protein, partial [Chloroflexota bacterium]|nr:transaldolase family protein [Chloroflexota bacterium]